MAKYFTVGLERAYVTPRRLDQDQRMLMPDFEVMQAQLVRKHTCTGKWQLQVNDRCASSVGDEYYELYDSSI